MHRNNAVKKHSLLPAVTVALCYSSVYKLIIINTVRNGLDRYVSELCQISYSLPTIPKILRFAAPGVPFSPYDEQNFGAVANFSLRQPHSY